MRVTIAEVARRAQVSKTTVSRVLNNKSDVDAVTAARVREVIAETGYIPSAGAVGLARGCTRTIGVFAPGLTQQAAAEVLQGASDVTEATGYGLLLHTGSNGEESLERFSRQVAAKAFDGLLLIEPPDEIRDLQALRESGLPVVVVDDRGGSLSAPSVRASNAGGGAKAARHLLDSDRTRLAVIAGPPGSGRARDRLAGFRAAVEDSGRFLDQRLIETADGTTASGLAAIRRLLANGVVFDGLFAHNDVTAAGALGGLREAGRKVPDDVAVVGFEDLPIAAHTEPTLTTVHRPLRELGEAAARLLLARLAGSPPATESVVVPTSIVVRASAPGTA